MTTPYRLKASEVAIIRRRLVAEQGGRCAICQLPLPAEKAVLDHDHATGAVRAALHSGCNALLGKIENNHKRYGVPNVHAFTNGVAAYLQRHVTNQTGYIYSTHKTEEEKRLLRNKRARLARAAKKET